MTRESVRGACGVRFQLRQTPTRQSQNKTADEGLCGRVPGVFLFLAFALLIQMFA